MLGGNLVATSTLKIAVAVVGLLSLSIGGAWVVGIIGAPSVATVDNAFGEVNESTTTIESELILHNPNPFGLQLDGLTVDYAVEMNGIRMATGGREGVSVAANGNTTIPLTTMMNNDRIPPWWISHVENGENTTLVIDASVHSRLVGQEFNPQVERTIDTNIIGGFNSDEDRPIEVDEPAVPNPVLWLNSTSGSWGAVSNETTEIDTTFELYNPNPTPVVLSEIGYEIRMNDVTMGEGATDSAVTIQSGELETVRATTALRNENLDEWWVTHLQHNQTTALEVVFYARIDLSAFGAGTVEVPLDTIERTIETDLFGNKASSEAGSEAGNNTETGGTETATPTPVETTPTPTPTDDGILSLSTL